MSLSPRTLLFYYTAHLNIEVEESDKYQIGTLLNDFAKEGATIKSINLEDFRRYDKKAKQYVDIDKDDIDDELVIYPFPNITIKSYSHEQEFRNDGGFTAKRLFDCIIEVEKVARTKSQWFGGVDLHHIYFEGLHLIKDQEHTYRTHWGS